VSDYETIQRRRNVIVGIFVVAGMCALGWLVFKFGDMPGLVSKMGSYDVFVQFAKAPGVQTDTPVRFCGYQVGMVTAVQPPKVMKEVEGDAFYHQTRVMLSINNSYGDIPADVNVVLLTRGFGSSYIDLQMGDYDVKKSKGAVLEQGSTLQGSTGVTSEFFPEETQEELKLLVVDMRTFIGNANDILGDPSNKMNVKRAVGSLAAVSDEAKARLQDANDTLRYINEAVQTVSKAIKDAQPMVEAVQKFVETGTKTLESSGPKADELITSLTGTSERLGKSLSEARSVLAKINSGEGSAGRFVNDGKFYETLIENTEQLELLLKEIKAFVSRAREKGVPIKLK